MLPVFPDLLSSSSVSRIFGPQFPEKQMLSVWSGRSVGAEPVLQVKDRDPDTWGVSGLKGEPSRLCQVQGEMVGGRPRGEMSCIRGREEEPRGADHHCPRPDRRQGPHDCSWGQAMCSLPSVWSTKAVSV